MEYVYESIQNGVVSLTLPGKDKTITLFKGDKITVDQKLSGGYLRILRLVAEVEEEKPVVETKVAGNSKAKVADKITKVEQVAEPIVEVVAVAVEDTVSAVTETEVGQQETPKEEFVADKDVEVKVEQEKTTKKNFKK